MSYAYAERKKHEGVKPDAPRNEQRAAALQSGAARPTAADMGGRADLPDAMRARMESSFGGGLSAAKLHESKGSGFLDGQSLEARGESVYGGAAMPLSTASAAPAAGPMQAKRGRERQPAHFGRIQLLEREPSWSDEKWSFGERRRNRKNHKNKTGLSNWSWKVRARMQQDMASMHSMKDEDKYEDDNTSLDDDDNEVYE